jgi:hypothetical protein
MVDDVLFALLRLSAGRLDEARNWQLTVSMKEGHCLGFKSMRNLAACPAMSSAGPITGAYKLTLCEIDSDPG